MKNITLIAALLAAASLAGCEKNTTVQPPATTVVQPTTVEAPAVVPVPVPGPQGPSGDKGDKGDAGKPGDTTVIVPAPAPANNDNH